MQTIQMLLRIVVLAMLAALIGAALRSLVKRTAVELLSSRTLTGLQPFLTTTNVRRWIHSAPRSSPLQQSSPRRPAIAFRRRRRRTHEKPAGSPIQRSR